MGFFRDLTGKTGIQAAGQAGDIQEQAAQEAAGGVQTAGTEAQGFLSPFAGVGARGVEESGFLADPQAQFEFLQNNPLFQSAVEQGARGIGQSAAAGSRISSGDTLQRLSENVLTSAQPLINRQRQDIFGLLNLGRGVASEQADITRGTAADVGNLLTGGAAARAAGVVGAANARGQRADNILSLAGGILGAPTTGSPGTVGGFLSGGG